MHAHHTLQSIMSILKPHTRIRPTDEERQAIREYLQQTEVPVTMVELFTRIGHTIGGGSTEIAG